ENIKDDVRTSEIEKLNRAINNVESISQETAHLEKQTDSFFQSDLTLLCFLTDDKADRYKTARAVLEIAGLESGKSRAKEWLFEKDKTIKESLNADKIEFL